MKPKKKYCAIKVKGMNHWLWFSNVNVTEEDGIFKGRGGWGEGGAFTDIDVAISQIEGRIESENLQYD